MTSEVFTLIQLCQQATGRASGLVGLREATKKGSGPLRLSYSPAALSVMAHNMALLPAFYKGTDRSGSIGQIVGQILAAIERARPKRDHVAAGMEFAICYHARQLAWFQFTGILYCIKGRVSVGSNS